MEPHFVIDAICARNLDRLKDLVRTGGPNCVNAPDTFGMTPLSKASQLGHLQMVKFLLQKGAQANGLPQGGGGHGGHGSCGNGAAASPVGSGTGNFRSPLVAATSAGRVAVVEELLNHGAHVDSTHMYEMTCLHIACDKGLSKVVAALLDHGANINAQDKRGWTPLYHAAQRGHLSCVQILLSVGSGGAEEMPAGSQENDKNDGNSSVSSTSTLSSLPPLEATAAGGMGATSTASSTTLQLGTPVWVRRKGQPASAAVSQRLLEGEVAYLGPVKFATSQNWVGVRLTGKSQGLGKNNGTVQGMTYFHTPDEATAQSGLFVRRSAITLRRRRRRKKVGSEAAGAAAFSPLQCCTVNTPSFHRLRTPLHVACERGRLPVVQYLIEQGDANLHARDQTGGTPFFSACYEGNIDVVKYLAQQCRNVDIVRNHAQETPLWVACFAGNLPVVDFLMEQGANVNARNVKGVSPFFMACAQGRVEMVASLLARGADPNAPNNDGVTPLGLACLRGRNTLARYLIQQQKEGGIRSQGVNLEATCACGSLSMTATPLWIASRQGNMELVRLLISQGANLDALDARMGLTPLAVAALQGHAEIVHFLILVGVQQPHFAAERTLNKVSHLSVSPFSNRKEA